MNLECLCSWRWRDTGWIHIHRYLSKESCDLRFFESDNFIIHLTPYIFSSFADFIKSVCKIIFMEIEETREPMFE